MNVMHRSSDAALRNAINRDLRDKRRLERIDTLVVNLIDALVPDVNPLEHPDARWSPDDLAETLLEQRRNIHDELMRVGSGMVVISPDDD